MRSLTLSLLATAACAIALPATAQSFSDSFQTTLANGNWSNIGNGQIVGAPVGGGFALNFSQTASGSDLLSNTIAGSGAGMYRLTVDYYCGRTGGCAGYIGLNPGSSTSTLPGSGDGWLATDDGSAYPTPFMLLSGDGAFRTNTFLFSVTTAGSFGLKLEDFNGAGGNIAGDAYFRNLSVSAVPEPATWAMMVMGFGMVGFGLRSRRKQAVRVTYA